jgi:hypothetical protein
VPTSEKIEPAPRGDHTRGLGGFGAGFFSAFNRNKRSLAIDLKSQDEQEAMYRLVRTADVVIENFGLPAFYRLNSARTASDPASRASRRGSASTMPRSWPRPDLRRRRSRHSRTQR